MVGAAGRPVKSVPTNNVLEPGQWVLAFLEEETAPWPAVLGEIQATGDVGFRLTLVNWQTKEADGFDFFVPWSCLLTCLVATPQHNVDVFRELAFEMQMNLFGGVQGVSVPVSPDEEEED